MPASSQKAPNIRNLRLSPDQLKAAKKFASDLGIGRTDDLYYYALLWYKENVRADGDFLSPSKRKRYDKELEKKKNNKTYKGAIGREIIGQIVILSTQEVEDKDLLKDTDTNAKPEIQAATVRVRKKTIQAAPPKPKVTITLDKEEVEKGESYTVSWKSENANYVSRSRGFTPQLKDVDLSGSQTLKAERLGSKTFYITVRNHRGSIAIASATVIIVQEKTLDSPTTDPTQQTPQQQRPRTTTTRISRRTTTLSDTQTLKKIDKSLDTIVGLLEKQSGIIKAVEKTRKKEAENERRSKRESILETAKSAGGVLVEKALTPIKSIFEKIWRFIFFTLLGRAFTEFLNWFNDPKNADKVKTLSRFLKDNFWLLIGGAALYFLTPFGGFINKLIGKLAWFSTKLVLSKAAQLMLKNPLLTIAAVSAFARQATYENLKPELEKLQEQAQEDVKNDSLPWYKRLGSFFANQELEGIKRKGQTEAIPAPGSMYSAGGFITTQTGDKIRGAGSDTQLTALTPGEVVMNRSAVQAVGADNLLALNKMYGGANANKPKKLGNIFGMSGGGMVGNRNPKISDADYNALLAIAAAEDFANPQGRADVAQSLYNRLYASKKYGENFSPTGGRTSLKDLITGKGQFEPTFKNREDWLNITDRKSAAIAFSNYKKIPLNSALKVLDDTDKILKSPLYQERAAKHVQGRTFFLGTSQHKNMKPESGDVVRSPKHNFFSHWYAQDSLYTKERGNVAAPVPNSLLQSKPKPKSKPQGLELPRLPSLSSLFSSASRPASASPNVQQKPTASTSRTAQKPASVRPNTPQKTTLKQKPWWDLSRFMGKKRGGSIGNEFHVNSNNFSINGLTDDRYPALLQAGEYVVPKLTVQRFGLSFFNDLVASTDENSEAAKIAPISRNQPSLSPLPVSANMAQIMTLPPIMSSQNTPMPRSTGTRSQIPPFPTVSPQASETRAFLAEIYKIA